MFDIGFWEVALIFVIGLVVLGPERLPAAIRSVMHWINTAKGIVNSVKKEISQELKLHEINENIIQSTKDDLKSFDADIKKSIDGMKKSAKEQLSPNQPEFDNLNPAEKERTEQTIVQGKKVDE